MEQDERLIEHEGGHGAGFGGRFSIGTGDDRLDQLEIPIAVNVPDKVIDRASGLVETEGLNGFGDRARRALGLAGDPAVERDLGASRIEAALWHAVIDLREARGVPKLGREVAITFDTACAELDVASLRRHGCKRESQRVGAVSVDQAKRIDDVPLRL